MTESCLSARKFLDDFPCVVRRLFAFYLLGSFDHVFFLDDSLSYPNFRSSMILKFKPRNRIAVALKILSPNET